ncbi:MAG: hypothetical protein WAM79_10250 [Candidatus Sulfotelmatobacter sp.]
MNPNLAIVRDGSKFMWDGQLYDNKEAALRTAQSYQDDGFQTQIGEEGGKYLVYSRRTAK